MNERAGLLPSILGFVLHEVIHRSIRSVVYRGTETSSGESVVLKVPTDDVPTPRLIARYERALEMGQASGCRTLIAHIGTVRFANTVALVTEDFGATDLERICPPEGFAVEELLRLAIGIAQALAELHAAGILHKDIKPGNIVVNRDTGTLKIIDLGIATGLTSEQLSHGPAQTLEGTLPYLAPEQTGRMSRSVDHRTDLYALGASLTHLATGAPPFDCADAAEYVHAHLARRPADLKERRSELPAAFSEIVARLLNKDPEDRYASAAGVARDLVRCRDDVREGRVDRRFELGVGDISPVFRIPQRLYGRDDEVAALMEEVRRAADGEAGMIFVTGSSGAGKTALVNETKTPVKIAGGRFCAGKFEQFRRDLPYHALVQAFSQLVSEILAAPEEQVKAVQARLRDALGANAALLTEVVDGLEHLVGPQPAVADVDPHEARLRFVRAMLHFVSAFASPEHPLLLFIDDLQWADEASLQFLNTLAHEPDARHVLVVGGFRDEEVAAGSPLRLLLDASPAPDTEASRAKTIRQLRVGPLDDAAVTALVADTLSRSADAVTPLAHLLMEKTAGSPFFVRELFSSLPERDLLKLEDSGWTWEADGLSDLDIADNVAGLLAAQLAELPADTLDVIRTAACVGAEFNLGQLNAAHEDQNLPTIAAALEPAVLGGQIVPLDADFSFAGAIAEEAASRVRYRFRHDRVHHAVHEQLTPNERSMRHLHIARQILASNDELPASMVIDLANHVAYGLEHVEQREERVALTRPLVRAAELAYRSSAFDAAERYLDAAQRLLPEDAHRDQRALWVALHIARAENAAALGEVDRIDAHAEEVLAHAASVHERVTVAALRQRVAVSARDYQRAVALLRESARALGFPLPQTANTPKVIWELLRTARLVGKRDPRSLAELPAAKDDIAIPTQAVFESGLTAAVFADPLLTPIVAMRGVQLSVTHGLTEHSAPLFGIWGLMLCGPFAKFEQGYAFGKLALASGQRFPGLQQTRGMLVFNMLRHWKEPPREAINDILQVFERALNEGSEEDANYAAGILLYYLFQSGRPLGESLVTIDSIAERIARTDQDHVKFSTLAWVQLLHCLTGTDPPLAFRGPWFDFAEQMPMLEAEESMVQVCVTATAAGVFEFFCGRPQAALKHLDRARPLIEQWMPGQLLVPILAGYRALAALDAARATGATRPLIKVAEDELGRLRKWEKVHRQNHAPRVALVDALLHSLRGRHAAANDAFLRAIDAANAAGFLGDEAIARERFAQHLLGLGLRRQAQEQTRAASAAYRRWGAMFLAERLAGEAATTTALQSTEDDGTSRGSRIDLASLMRGVNAISSEVDLDRLVEVILRISIENVGADRGLLVLKRAEDVVVEVESDGDGKTTRPQVSLSDFGAAAKSVIGFVSRTSEPVVLDDASEVEPHRSDPHIRAASPRSVLCVPLRSQGLLVGLMYFENHALAGAFTADRVQIVEALGTQAATSIETARVYGELERLVEERTEQLAAATTRAESASEAKSVFLRTMSHELRTPLNAILGYAQLLLDRSATQNDDKEALRTIQSSGQHLLDLINDVLDMSRIEAGRLEFENAPVRLPGLTEGVVDLFRPAAEAKAVALTVESDAGLPEWVEADVKRVRQVLLNLVGNAVKFTGEGVVAVRVALSSAEVLCVSVRDTGPGIADGQLASVFAPFEQAGSQEQRAKGTGLGLAISSRIARQMGGALRVESVVGEGSTFFFEMPLVRCAPVVDERPVAVETPSDDATIEMKFPNAAELSALRGLMEEGALPALARRAQAIAADDEQLAAFSHRLTTLARAFDEAAIERLLDKGLSTTESAP
jgi:predicted ATPase/signal transduction histidine kinase